MANSIPFNPTLLDQDIPDTRNIVDLLPPIHQTDTNQRFFSSSINHLFTPGAGTQINGYVGEQPPYYDPTQDFYLIEPTTSRQFYQLEATMVSKDVNNNITAMLFYPDIINQLRFQGAIVNNHNRLFEQNYYSWCPPVNLDKLINYRLYFWVEADDNQSDYLVIQQGSPNLNPWSVNNLWVHQDDLTDAQKAGSPTQASRPIVEFQADLELFNYGTSRRDAVYACANSLTLENLITAANITPTPTITIDGIAISSGTGSVRILVLNDGDSLLDNQVYLISFTGDDGTILLNLETDGVDPSGLASVGDILLVENGFQYGGIELYFNGITWIVGQQKTDRNVNPLFNIYDANGVVLNSPTTYPGSTFAGNKLFSYAVDTTGTSPIDPVLGFGLTYDVYGQINFENYLTTTPCYYTIDNVAVAITGFYFHKSTANSISTYSNDWYAVVNPSRQMMVDQYVCDGVNNVFALSQQPDPNLNSTLPNLQVYRISQVASATTISTFVELTEGVDYFRMAGAIILGSTQVGDVLKIKTYSTAGPFPNATGFYEVPANLQSNPNNEQVAIISTGDYYQQFSQIMANQVGFSGQPFADNNWRNLIPDLSLGQQIIQNDANLLNLCLTLQNSDLDYMNSVRYAETEYTRFRNKFELKIGQFYSIGKSQTNLSSGVLWQDTWINDALTAINKGKTQTFPFAYSGIATMVGNTTVYQNVGYNSTYLVPTFIPPTPSFLGVYPLSVPALIADYTFERAYNNTNDTSIPQVVIRNHDGSLTPSYGQYQVDKFGNLTPYNGITDPRDAVILQLETRIYNSVIPVIVARERPTFDWQIYYSTYSRMGDYSYQEYLFLLQPDFDRWVNQYDLDFRTNSIFDPNDPFTWNWSQVAGLDGNYLPGHWRGIYQYYYDTDSPHTTPWQMLGFAIQPSYWSKYYGSAPYTSNNVAMWRDLQNGYIAEGTRQGINTPWARPILSQYIPVDEEGNLLDPAQAGIAQSYPSTDSARQPWKFGDCGPVEASWRRSSLFPFAVAQAGYLMKPGRFFGALWDSGDYVAVSGQLIDQSTKDRPSHAEIFVHGETNSSGNIIVKYGIQQWISNYLVNLNQNITVSFGNPIRGLNVQLAYKMASFTDLTSLSVSSEAFGSVPAEDEVLQLYQSPSIREEFYSGVIISYDGTWFSVYGYDILNPSFNVIQPNTTGPASPLAFDSVQPAIIPNWTPGKFYIAGVTVNHTGIYYFCLRSHTADIVFESVFWQVINKPAFVSVLSVNWYSNAVNTNIVSVPYGSKYSTLQEVANFLNGLERYYISRGWVFSQVINNSYTSDWLRSCYEFLAWFKDNQSTPGSFIALSPASTAVEFNTTQGEAQSVEQFINGTYSLIDRSSKPINPSLVDIARSDGQLIVTPVAAVNGGIFGCRLYVSEIEHVLAFDNKTIFDDIIYNPLLNIKQPRLRLQGFKTTNWYGRLDAPGFIVNGTALVPNFEKTADDLRHLFDIETVDDDTLQERARNNVGYAERNYLTALLMTPTNQFEFYQGMIQQKGTPTVMNRLLRSNFIRNNEDIQFLEEWLFRVGDYGSAFINPSFDLQLMQSQVATDPQLIVFNVNSSPDSSLGNDVINITDVTGSNPIRDPRWVWQQSTAQIAWRMTQFKQKQKGFLPNTGYVNINNVSWTAPTRDDLINLYYSTLANAPSTVIQPVYTYSYDGINGIPQNFRVPVIQNLVTGYLRINKVEFNVTQSFIANALSINVGRINSPQEFARASSEILASGGDFTAMPSAFFELNDNNDNSVYVEFVFNQLTVPVGANIGSVQITIYAEQFIDSVLPNHRVLVYTDILGDWNTYKLQDTNSVIDTAFVPSYPGQGSPISMITLDPAIVTTDLILLEGVNNTVTTEEEYVFDSVFNPVFSNTARLVINSTVIAAATINSAGYSEIPVLQMLPTTGMVIDNLTFNVVQVFSGSIPTAKIQVGTDLINNYFVNSFTPPAEFVENNPQITIAPSFAINDPVSIDIYDTTISVAETDTSIPIQIIRSGNIYNSLTAITVTNPGSGYITPPTVTVSGPQGVVAVASLAGGVLQILITSGGSGYTSAPIVVITGGNGLGAQAYATISGGVVTSVVLTAAGAGYTTQPTVIISGGGGNGAAATATVNYGVASISVTSTGGCLYNGITVPSVTLVGGGGTGATATTQFNTPLAAMTVNWRYYQNSPNLTGWVEAGSVIFEPVGTILVAPQDPVTGYWLQTVNLPFVTPEQGSTIYQVEIYNSNLTDTSYEITQNIATVTVVKTKPDSNGVDLTQLGTTVIIGQYVLTDDMMNVYMLANGNTGVVVLNVNYHYTNGFEVFNLDGTPNIIVGEGNGGRILGWYPTRFASTGARDSAIIPVGWQPNDIVEIDYDPSVLTSGGWSTYQFYDVWDSVRTGIYNVNLLIAQINALLPTAGQQLSASVSAAIAALNIPTILAEISALVPPTLAPWTQIDTETLQVESCQFVNATIYNNRTDAVLATLQLFDPYQGYIVGTADRELTFKVGYDPAIYNMSSDPSIPTASQYCWGSSQVNQLWWNLSTVRYIDYEINTTAYRWKNWGMLAPGTSIDVYQWVRSPVPPSNWSIFVQNASLYAGFDTTTITGIVANTTVVGWVEQQEWIPALSREATAYYFWVQNVADVPPNCGRQISAVQVEAIIANPSSQSIPWFAVVDSNKLIVSGIKQYLDDTDTVLNMKWKIDKNEGNYHKQWKIIREADTTTSIDITLLWNKMRDSLIGWDDFAPTTTFTTQLATQFSTTDKVINVIDGSGFAVMGQVLINSRIVSYGYKNNNQLMELVNNLSVSAAVGTNVSQTTTKPDPQLVPDPMLTPKEALGNLIRPRQSWFPADAQGVPSRYARQIFVESFNKLMQEKPYVDVAGVSADAFNVSDPAPDPSTYTTQAASLDIRNQLATFGDISFGQTVYVPAIADTNNFWTVWLYTSNDQITGLPIFELINAQKYDFIPSLAGTTGYLWNLIDWYAEGWGPADYPLIHFPNRITFMAAPFPDLTLLEGTLVMIDAESATDPRWSWQLFQNGPPAGYIEVAKQAGTYALTSTFYDPTKVLYGFGSYNLADIPNRDGSWELKVLLNNLATTLFTPLQMNEIFFSMSRCALSISDNVDWIIKSSFMTIAGFSEPLQQNPLSYPDQIDSITSYIQEVKPYHVTIRNYLLQYTVGPDQPDILHVTDFDVGTSEYAGMLITAQTVIQAQLAAQAQAQIIALGVHKSAVPISITPFVDVSNAQNGAWNGLRHSKISVLFDRISCSDTDVSGWDLAPWDYSMASYQTANIPGSHVGALLGSYQAYLPSNNNGNYIVLNDNFESAAPSFWDLGSTSDAASRISLYYQPTENMPTTDLISGCSYRGYVFDGGPLAFGLWNEFGWSFEGGWSDEDAYYDGAPVSNSINTYPNDQPAGEATILSVDFRPGDFDLDGGGFRITNAQTAAEYFSIDGGNYVNPNIGSGNPEELVPLNLQGYLTIILNRKDSSGNISTIPFWSFPDNYVPSQVVNNLWNNSGLLTLGQVASYPTSSASLAAGSVWSNGLAVSVVPGVTPYSGATPVYFNIITANQLLTLGGGNLPLTNTTPGSGQLWNDNGFVSIA